MMKGQASVEFMVFICVLMVILSVFLWSDMSLQNRIIGIKSNTEAKELCDSIAFEINTAARAGDGYKRDFFVKSSFFGALDFNVSVENYSVFIDWNGKSVSSSIIIQSVSGTGVVKGMNTIENKDGVIHVN